MSEAAKPYGGGCLCGAVRYEADGPPDYAGHCYCADCRKASGSGFIPFMNYPAARLRFTGQTLRFADASLFVPTIAIFNRDRPDWALVPPGLTVFETMPG